MTLLLTITLPFGRYSATPWGRHVNEGAVEWPPAPWRIVRALVSSWHVHHPDLAAGMVTEALELLCDAPRYDVPTHTITGTRHYLPTDALPPKKRRWPGNPSTSLALQPFVAAEPGVALTAVWEAEPSEGQLSTLNRLARTVSYLGRAESRAMLAFSTGAPPSDLLGPIAAKGLGTSDVLDLLVPDRPLDLDEITTTTASLQDDRRTTPPGTRWVAYPTPTEGDAPPARTDRPTPAPVQVLQYEITSSAAPTMDNAGLLAAMLRHIVTSRAPDDHALHGHRGDEGSNHRVDGHQHAHYLVLAGPRQTRASRLVIWAPGGISAESVAGLAGMTHLNVPDHLSKRLGNHNLDVVLTQVGQQHQLENRLAAPARTWRTMTPVTTGRHRKRRQSVAEFAVDVVRRELAYRRMPAEEDVAVEVVPDEEYLAPMRSRTNYRQRTLDASRRQTGFHVKLEFAQPQPGPIVLGKLAHFGLGVFVHDGTV